MHELSLVEALIEQVQEEVSRAGVEGRVVKLELNIGRLSGVHCESLRFAFDLLLPDSILCDAEILIHESKPICRCNWCYTETKLEDLVFQCPHCASEDITIEGGRELLLQSIEIEEGSGDLERPPFS